jgi:hypothetical protein
MVERGVHEGFLRDVHRDLLLADKDPTRLLDRLVSYVVPVAEKWMDTKAR